MFTQDSRAENFLNQMGAKWTYRNDVPSLRLKDGWDEHNVGRSQVCVNEAIEEYGALMDAGSPAPAPILHETADGFDVLDGIQRLVALIKRHHLEFSAYVVETDANSMVAKIRTFANYRIQGGFQESSEWTLTNAIQTLVMTNIMSIEELADCGGWAKSKVRDKKTILDFGEAIRGVGGPDSMPDSVVRVIAKYAHGDDFQQAPDILGRFTGDLQRMQLSAEDAEPHIERFFAVSRKGKIYSRFKDQLRRFHDDEDIAVRMADPRRRTFQSMTADGRLAKQLRATLTTIERIAKSCDTVVELDTHYQLLARIKREIAQLTRRTRKGRRNGR